MSEQNKAEAPQVELSEILAQRLTKLDAMREKGQAFPNDFRRENISDDLHKLYDAKSKEELEELAVEVSVAGRMMTRRIMGKASFATIQDMGGQVQVYVARDNLAEGFYNTEFKKWDLGDIVGAKGVLFKTQTDELSIKVSEIRILTKALRPLPDKFHGLSDTEACYRQRYLDLIANEESRKTFILRNKIVNAIRTYLNDRQFMEVETPMLQAIPGGATARPFETFHNALDLPMYLRIAPELNLKRLVVGGFERVFEINRSFRNEGVSTRHNPEFTMIEFYQAYADYIDLMNLTEDMLRTITENVLGSSIVKYGEEEFDFGKPFVRLTMKESILEYNEGIEAAELDSMEGLKALAKRLDIHIKDSWGEGKVLTEIFEETAEHKLMQPTFITAYPAEVSPLARRNDDNPDVTDRFEFFVGGRELANGFSELNDAQDQAQRFMDQVAQKESGDDEAMFYDADYITALEHGLPPTAGEGIGIDRLVMLFTDSHTIRDVLLFPHMRPQAK
ncbi:lysine--tRNA ligase [Psychromonas sp. 14N.309.X.WAT.B.A12]|uniref:lysine--tRNA ligase n=1 Tax=unclassified Psychromonas TaxID=2614957 RepID=UPI0025B1C548|nr:lysine--tRNA ligase [Psychromonas sp. 14N.309.X.WAT.B.A12]MDN2664357.1 lysine--tRNA ligase [Psychromonas sp. 14N.309.X.WAT.B.A12]